MSETPLNEAAQRVAATTRKANETVIASAIAAGQRNIHYAQSVLEQGLAVYKQQAESATALTQALVGHAGDPKAAWQTWSESAVAAQERAMHFTQGIVEQGIAVMKAHSESAQALAQELLEQTHQQQEAYRTLAQEALNATWNGAFSATRTH